jgi:hypothetical protein
MGTTSSIPNEVRGANEQLLCTVARSRADIPPIFALLRYVNGIQEERYNGILVSASKVMGHNGIWKFDILKNPYHYIDNGHLVAEETDHWFQGKSHRYLTVNEKHELIVFNIQYHQSIIRVGGSNQMIPVCYIPNVTTVLGDAFLHINDESMMDSRIVLKPGPLYPSAMLRRPIGRNVLATLPTASATSLPTASATSLPTALPVTSPAALMAVTTSLATSVSALPVAHPTQKSTTKTEPQLSQFIVNELIEGIVARGIECPITMEKITKEDARVLPCGHTVSLAAVEHFPQGARSCPQCRKKFSPSQVQQWK